MRRCVIPTAVLYAAIAGCMQDYSRAASVVDAAVLLACRSALCCASVCFSELVVVWLLSDW